jgi:type II secretory pathway pseudopilin PulG
MTGQRRTGFGRLDALVVVVGLGLVLALAVPFVLRARLQARREQSANNLRRLIEATHAYSDNHKQQLLPPGCDDKHFSAVAKLLPYLGEKDLHKTIDFSRSIDDPVNEAARRTRLDVLLSPLDDQPAISKDPTKAPAPTNYLFNGLAFPYGHGLKFPGSFLNGTSQTVFITETLRGDGNAQAVDVNRQHIVLSERQARRYSREFRHEMGVAEFRDNRDVAADRCSSWMDGRMLQGTFISGAHSRSKWLHAGQRCPNEPRPDVVVEIPGELDGLAAPRSLTDIVIVGLGDGSTRNLDVSKLLPDRWIKVTDPDWVDEGSEW